MPTKAIIAIADALEPLTHMQRVYVESRFKGMSKIAAATAAGCANPQKNAYKIEDSVSVKNAMAEIRAVGAAEVNFGVKEAYEMYMTSFHVAATSAEMTKAVDSMVKLLGIAKPEVKEIHTHHSGKVDHHKVVDLSDEELLKLANLKPENDPFTIEGEAITVEEVDGG